MIQCEEAGQMIDQQGFEKLSWGKRRKLKFHLRLCKMCKKYENDNHILAKIIRMAGPKHCDSVLSETDKQEMKSKLVEQ
ncbi:MAG: hypothetical protein ACI857_003376 [Arenicella sp.]|jgi:hypothetical protein